MADAAARSLSGMPDQAPIRITRSTACTSVQFGQDRSLLKSAGVLTASWRLPEVERIVIAPSPRPLNHIGIGVSDINAAIRWYEEVLGYRVFSGPFDLTLENDQCGQLKDVLGPKFRKLKIAHLSSGTGCGIELFESIEPPHERRTEDIEFHKSGTFHICVTDPDIEGLIGKIVASGGRQLSKIWDDRPPLGRFRMAYCQDPWGTLIEVHTHSYEVVQGWR
jgi:catechol 2,3-dioxygenase-like lactoylglutathione lyase family enzyme